MKKQGTVVRCDSACDFGFIRSPANPAGIFFHVRDFHAAHAPGAGLTGSLLGHYGPELRSPRRVAALDAPVDSMLTYGNKSFSPVFIATHDHLTLGMCQIHLKDGIETPPCGFAASGRRRSGRHLHLKCCMRNKTLLSLVLLSAVFGAQAQSTPAKKELSARIIKLQQPGIENMARSLAEQPAAGMMEQVRTVLPARVAPDKQEAVAKEINAEVKKYVDEAVPLVRDRAIKLAPSTVGAVLEEKFTEEELRQVIAVMESPAWIKFQQLGPDMQKPLMEKLVAETRPLIDPKIKALDQSIAKSLGVTEAGGSAKPASPAAPAKTGKPATK